MDGSLSWLFPPTLSPYVPSMRLHRNCFHKPVRAAMVRVPRHREAPALAMNQG